MDLSQELDTALRTEFPHLQDLPPEALKPATPLFGPDGIGLDSIDALELVVILRRRFKVEIPDRTAGERAFKSFGALVEFVRGASKR